jgi:hypothetical protein
MIIKNFNKKVTLKREHKSDNIKHDNIKRGHKNYIFKNSNIKELYKNENENEKWIQKSYH